MCICDVGQLVLHVHHNPSSGLPCIINYKENTLRGGHGWARASVYYRNCISDWKPSNMNLSKPKTEVDDFWTCTICDVSLVGVTKDCTLSENIAPWLEFQCDTVTLETFEATKFINSSKSAQFTKFNCNNKTTLSGLMELSTKRHNVQYTRAELKRWDDSTVPSRTTPAW